MTTILIDNIAETLYVDNSGGIETHNDLKQFDKINDAIDICGDKDQIFVKSGTYNEIISVGTDRKIKLIGEDKYTTIINGSGKYDVMKLTSDLTKVSGFTIPFPSRKDFSAPPQQGDHRPVPDTSPA